MIGSRNCSCEVEHSADRRSRFCFLCTTVNAKEGEEYPKTTRQNNYRAKRRKKTGFSQGPLNEALDIRPLYKLHGSVSYNLYFPIIFAQKTQGNCISVPVPVHHSPCPHWNWNQKLFILFYFENYQRPLSRRIKDCWLLIWGYYIRVTVPPLPQSSFL